MSLAPYPLKTLPYEPACFAGGTLVHTKNGLVPIERIQVGDWVLSKHESGEGEREYKRVTKTFVHEEREVIRVAFGGKQADGTDKWDFMIVTPEHPIWVQGKGWKPAEKLKYHFPFINLELLTDESPKIYGYTRLFVTDKPDIAWVPSTNVSSDLGRVGTHINVLTNETVATGVALDFESARKTGRVKHEHLFRTTVYNIEVEDFHTYYVGKAGVWVHNKNIRAATTAPDGKPLSGYQLTTNEAASPFLGKGEMYVYLAKNGDATKDGVFVIRSGTQSQAEKDGANWVDTSRWVKFEEYAPGRLKDANGEIYEYALAYFDPLDTTGNPYRYLAIEGRLDAQSIIRGQTQCR